MSGGGGGGGGPNLSLKTPTAKNVFGDVGGGKNKMPTAGNVFGRMSMKNPTGRRPNDSTDEDNAARNAAGEDNKWIQNHLDNAPKREGSMYGDAGYNPEEFGYDRQDLGPVNDEDFYKVDQVGVDQLRGHEAVGADTTGYDVNEMRNMNFDPYRQNALQGVAANSASAQKSAEGAMERSGGLTASDRMNMASRFNRDKIAGSSEARGKYDEMDAQSQFNVGNANQSAQNKQNEFLAGAENLASGNLAAERNAAGNTLTAAQNKQMNDNAAGRTTRNKDLYAEKRRVGEANTTGANAKSKADADRRYKEKGDLYASEQDVWNQKGQFKSGGAIG